jgi:hypothetical protein
MRFLRTLTTPLIFLACLGISLAAAWEVWQQGVPEEDPSGRLAQERQIATREAAAMVQELAARRLDGRPREQQYAFVDRLDFFLRRGAEVSARPADFDRGERRHLRENAVRVAQIWLRSRANRYDRLPPREQRPYINEQVLALQGWAPLAALAFGFEPRDVAILYQIERLDAARRGGLQDPRLDDLWRARFALQDWVDSQDPDQRRRILDFLQVLQERFLLPR